MSAPGPGAVSALLPPAFTERMGELLGRGLPRFLDALDQPRVRGLRLNPAKTTHTQLRDLLRIPLDPVPWCRSGFALPAGTSLGGHPAHLAGLFYLQEPSAMSVAEILDPEPGWLVADLAASPGGKTTHLASLVGSGLVVANEVSARRLRRLQQSLAIWGAANVVTAGLPLGELAGIGVPFDGVVLDAPCSGEAVFRRSGTAIRQWSPAAVRGAARRQKRLLAEAARLVRPGGALVYSTCTFEVEENEQRIAEFVRESPGWVVDDSVLWPGVQPGCALPPARTERAARFWPHRVRGDGQFVARLRRAGDDVRRPCGSGRPGRNGRASRSGAGSHAAAADAAVRRAWAGFKQAVIPDAELPGERLHVRGDRLFLLPGQFAGLRRERLSWPGLPLGRLRPGRFEPHPALASTLTRAMVTSQVSWEPDDPRLCSYLRGAAVRDGGPDGWTLVCMREWGTGWAKRSGGVLKNMVPAYMRVQAARYRP